MRNQRPVSKPGKTPGPAAHLRSLLILGTEVVRNAVDEVRWRRQRERKSTFGTGVTS